MKTVLLIGASGFVGSALLQHFVFLGCKVLALSRRPPGETEIEGVEYLIASQDNVGVVRSALQKCDCVVHAASDSTPGVTSHQPTLEVDVNIRPTLRFLETMQSHANVHLIYLSSAGALYQTEQGALSAESDPVAPRSNYGAGKVAVEAFIGAACRAHGGRATILRPTNVFGPGQIFRPGFGIVPTLMSHAWEGHPFPVWGDGGVERDYLFINDLAKLCELVWADPAQEAECRLFNAGSSVATTTLELMRMVESVTGRPLHPVFQSIRSVDSPRIVVDSRKAQQQLNWRPSVGLGQGLACTWDWFKSSRPMRPGK